MALGSGTASNLAGLRVQPVHATFRFTDIEGSTQLARRLGQDRWMEVMSDHHRIVGDAISRTPRAIWGSVRTGSRTSPSPSGSTELERALLRELLLGDAGQIVTLTGLYTKSLGQASTHGESHQVMMDMRAVALCLLRLGKTEPALEVGELVALEEQRTGRHGDNPDWFLLREELTTARRAANAEVLERATTRARGLPVAARADRVVELARAATNSDAHRA